MFEIMKNWFGLTSTYDITSDIEYHQSILPNNHLQHQLTQIPMAHAQVVNQFPSGLASSSSGAATQMQALQAQAQMQSQTAMYNGPKIFTDYSKMEIGFSIENKTIFTIKSGGKIEKGPGFTTDDESSLKFLEAMMDQMPVAWWKGLIKRRNEQ